MAVIERDVSLKRYGSLGGALVFSSWKGRQLVKSKGKYVYRNTPEQEYNRDRFRRAVKAWQELDDMTKYLWRALAYGKVMSGYEYFIKKFVEDRA